MICCHLESKREIAVKNLDNFDNRFNNNKSSCKQCETEIQLPKKFCTKSCSTQYNNKKRYDSGWRLSNISKDLIKNSINSKPLKVKKTKNWTKPDTAVYCKLFTINCNHCNTIVVSRYRKKYCNNHSYLYKSNNRNRYAFTFNVYHYPDLFNLSLIKIHGWYGPGGRSKKWNLNGISRDHKISVNEAIKNDYDPYYIKHMLNCELMLQTENNTKKTKSTISYSDLITAITEYDNIHLN